MFGINNHQFFIPDQFLGFSKLTPNKLGFKANIKSLHLASVIHYQKNFEMVEILIELNQDNYQLHIYNM